MESDEGESNISLTRDFMNSIRFDTVSEEIEGLIYSARDFESRVRYSTMTDSQVREAFTEIYPPAILF